MAFQLWDRLLGRKSGAMSSVDLLREMLGGDVSASGIRVTPENALEATVVFACARAISEGLSMVPFRLMRTDGRTRLPAGGHALYRMVEDGPNEWQTRVEFLDQIGLHLAIANEAFIWKNTPGRQIGELLPLEPKFVTVKREKFELRYTVTMPGTASREIPAAEMWHIRGPSWNGYRGLEGWKLAREAIGLSLAAEQHGAATFRNGAQLGGVLSTDQTLSAEQRKSLRESWQQVHAGASNAGRIAVMSHGFKFSPSSSSNQDAQWLEARRFQIEEVCRAFRVLPIMVGYSDKTATYASAEAMFIAHVVHTLGPWYARLEASANKNLLSVADREQGHYFKFFVNALLRGASKDRGEFYKSLYGIGAINPNEIRDLEDMNPYTGGDAYRVPLNMVDPTAPPPEPAAAPDPAADPAPV